MAALANGAAVAAPWIVNKAIAPREKSPFGKNWLTRDGWKGGLAVGVGTSVLAAPVALVGYGWINSDRERGPEHPFP